MVRALSLHDSTSTRPRCFSVNLAIGRYRCHRCHRQGHQLELWAAATKLPLYQAAIDLCIALGVEVPWIHRWCIVTEQRRGHRYLGRS